MGKMLKFLALVLLILLVIVAARTVLYLPNRSPGLPHTSEGVDAQKAATELAATIPFQTISYEGGGTAGEKAATQAAFVEFHAYLEKTFPRVYASLAHEVVGANNLLFEWKGSELR